MKVYRNIADFPRLNHLVATVGTFDGVHLGHREIIKQVIRVAQQSGGESVLITFDPHPRHVVDPMGDEVRLLTLTDEKIFLLNETGIDHLMIIPFDAAFASLPFDCFVTEILSGAMGIKHIVVGYDHAFGKGREGNFERLSALGSQLGFTCEQIDERRVNDHVVSSTRIRNFLAEGDVEHANELLGHEFFIFGEVVKGNQIGNTLGFPTINLGHFAKHKLIPAMGVYASRIDIDGTMYLGMTNVGVRPTFDASGLTIETHIFDFDQDIYGKRVVVTFTGRIREERKFNGLDELIVQLNRDKDRAFEIFNS
ncbi:MAG: bifunctional riboflavin kinase/FAD synthetase [Bacteroidota bacterium]|nr:bifunctional riboflavin kinase/FAD synthetase [Bacteroidota bacterium]